MAAFDSQRVCRLLPLNTGCRLDAFLQTAEEVRNFLFDVHHIIICYFTHIPPSLYLLQLIKNILEHPLQIKFRELRLSNQVYVFERNLEKNNLFNVNVHNAI